MGIVEGLQSAEDEAFEQALEMWQRSMLLKMEKRLTIEAEEHMCAVEAERQRKEEVANYEMHKTRLEKFYTKYCPEKSGSEDRILKTCEGRLELLDQRLKKKYGTGFRPVISKIKSKLGTNTGGKDIDSDTDDEKMIVNGFSDVSVQVSCNDILPSLCGVVSNFTPNTTSRIDSSVTLKYFIVDCRSDERANTEGRFPTAKIMRPEVLMDPDRMQQLVDVLESFRGAIHICIMGEGYSSLPSLYNQDDDLLVDTLLEEDKSRTNNCALFFVKRGFPFISILDGGFFSAHSWLCRKGPALGLSADMEHMDRSSKTSSRVLQRLVNRYVSNAVDIKKKLEENYGGSNDINEGNRFKMTFSNFLNTNSKNTENIRTVDGDFQMDLTANEECLKSQKTEIDTIKEKNSFKMAISSLSRKWKIIDHKDKERVANQDTLKTKENENNLFKKPFGRLISNTVEGKYEEENEEEKVQKLDVNVDQVIEN